jgi:hypothetical protein
MKPTFDELADRVTDLENELTRITELETQIVNLENRIRNLENTESGEAGIFTQYRDYCSRRTYKNGKLISESRYCDPLTTEQEKQIEDISFLCPDLP